MTIYIERLSFSNIAYIAGISGLLTSSTISIGLIFFENYISPDWRDIAAMGSIGSILGARYAIKGIKLY